VSRHYNASLRHSAFITPAVAFDISKDSSIPRPRHFIGERVAAANRPKDDPKPRYMAEFIVTGEKNLKGTPSRENRRHS
jgi:hypothetical protein